MPKINKSDLSAATCEANPLNEWCPPGHGDIYAALAGSGRLAELLAAGPASVVWTPTPRFGTDFC